MQQKKHCLHPDLGMCLPCSICVLLYSKPQVCCCHAGTTNALALHACARTHARVYPHALAHTTALAHMHFLTQPHLHTWKPAHTEAARLAALASAGQGAAKDVKQPDQGQQQQPQPQQQQQQQQGEGGGSKGGKRRAPRA